MMGHMDINTIFDINTYGSGNETLATCYRTLLGIDLDRFNHNGDLITGVKTIGSNLTLDLKFKTNTPANFNLYCSALFDIMYTIQDGLLMANY